MSQGPGWLQRRLLAILDKQSALILVDLLLALTAAQNTRHCTKRPDVPGGPSWIVRRGYVCSRDQVPRLRSDSLAPESITLVADPP